MLIASLSTETMTQKLIFFEKVLNFDFLSQSNKSFLTFECNPCLNLINLNYPRKVNSYNRPFAIHLIRDNKWQQTFTPTNWSWSPNFSQVHDCAQFYPIRGKHQHNRVVSVTNKDMSTVVDGHWTRVLQRVSLETSYRPFVLTGFDIVRKYTIIARVDQHFFVAFIKKYNAMNPIMLQLCILSFRNRLWWRRTAVQPGYFNGCLRFIDIEQGRRLSGT